MSVSNFNVNMQPKDLVVIGERRFFLNKCRSKHVSVGLNYDLNFAPSIQINGNKNDLVVFTEKQFETFLDSQGIVTHNLYKNGEETILDCGAFVLEFKKISGSLVLKILKDNSTVYLAYDTVCMLWNLLPLLKYTCDLLKRQEFQNYYKVLQRSLIGVRSNVNSEALKLLSPTELTGSNNIALCLEFISLYPQVFEEDCTAKVQL